jgi:hypothetical protein
MSDILFIFAAALLSMGLWSFDHPILFKLGSYCILVTSFLVGQTLTGRWEVGVLFAASWLLLPWLEILTRVRKARLPLGKPLRHQYPPSRDRFPDLGDLTQEMEEEGFEQVDDAGWDWAEHRQFFRLFYNSEERLQASICLVSQEDAIFYYLSFSSRGKDGTSWTTWNYPFPYAMKFAPQFRTNRLWGDRTILEMVASHREFMQKSGVSAEALALLSPEEMQRSMQQDMEHQIAYNIAAGLLLPVEEGSVRYSWRGLFFIWIQFLRDFVRFS